MDGVTALAQHIKNRDNPTPYTPMFGKIISLPELKIRLGSSILLYEDDVKATFDIYEKIHHDGYTEYVNLNKEVVLLPYSEDNKFVVIGVIQ
ncbi:MAG: DUF2577 family protein [Clostridia bacterium]|nr:DUF2577 family protein [Clostridia bacterium]